MNTPHLLKMEKIVIQGYSDERWVPIVNGIYAENAIDQIRQNATYTEMLTSD